MTASTLGSAGDFVEGATTGWRAARAEGSTTTTGANAGWDDATGLAASELEELDHQVVVLVLYFPLSVLLLVVVSGSQVFERVRGGGFVVHTALHVEQLTEVVFVFVVVTKG